MNGKDNIMMILKVIYRVIVIAAKLIEAIMENEPAAETFAKKMNGANGSKINGVNGD